MGTYNKKEKRTRTIKTKEKTMKKKKTKSATKNCGRWMVIDWNGHYWTKYRRPKTHIRTHMFEIQYDASNWSSTINWFSVLFFSVAVVWIYVHFALKDISSHVCLYGKECVYLSYFIAPVSRFPFHSLHVMISSLSFIRFYHSVCYIMYIVSFL